MTTVDVRNLFFGLLVSVFAVPNVLGMRCCRPGRAAKKETCDQRVVSPRCEQPADMQQATPLSRNDMRAYEASQLLHYVLLHNNWGVRRALAAGAEIEARDQSGYTALQIASSSGDSYMVRLLLEYGACVDAKATWTGCTALHCVATSASTDVLRELLRLHADLEAVNFKHETPLQQATVGVVPVSWYAKKKFIRALLEHDAQMSEPTSICMWR